MNRVIPIVRKVLKWTLGIALVLVLLLLLTMEIFDRYLASEKGAAKFYSKVPQEVMIKRTDSGVRYLEIGDAAKPALMLIHGAPGSIWDWRAFAMRERVYDRYRLLIVERPGYGASRPKGAEPSIMVQSERLLEVLESEAGKTDVMGHSYGAPIAVAMAGLGPEKIGRVIAASGQYDPDNEMILKVSYFVQFGIFRYLLPRMLWVSNVEKLEHPKAQREAMEIWPKVTHRVELIHGDADSLVPYENSPWVAELLGGPVDMITLPGLDHAIHFTEVEYMVDFALSKVGNPPSPPAPES